MLCNLQGEVYEREIGPGSELNSALNLAVAKRIKIPWRFHKKTPPHGRNIEISTLLILLCQPIFDIPSLELACTIRALQNL